MWSCSFSVYHISPRVIFCSLCTGVSQCNKSRNAPVTRAESGNSLQGWEVDETIEERSGQVNFVCLYNAKGVSPWVAECSSPF